MITKDNLLEHGLWVDDISNIAKDCNIIVEPPVRILNTEVKNANIGAYTYMRGGFVQNVRSIGRFCSIAKGLTIGLGEHPIQYLSTHPFQYEKIFPFWNEAKQFNAQVSKEKMKSSPVIGNDVWIGANVTILRGVNIGDGAIIASGAIVNRDVQPYEIVGGVPAKRIKFRFSEEIIKELLDLKWWNYTLESLEGIDFTNINKAIEELKIRKIEERLVKRKFERLVIVNREIIKDKTKIINKL